MGLMNSHIVKKHSRISWVDIAKAIGILLVVIGHAPRVTQLEQYGSMKFVNAFIYSFHMELFFFLSGYVAVRNAYTSIYNYINKKIKTLIIPWITYGMLIYAIIAIGYQIAPVRNILQGTDHELISITEYWLRSLNSDNPYSYHLWYIWILFWVQLLAELIWRVSSCVMNKFKSHNEEKYYMAGLVILAYCVLFFIPVSNQTLFYIKRHIVFYLLGMFARNIDLNKISCLFASATGILVTTLNVFVVKYEIIESSFLIHLVKRIHYIIGIPCMILLIFYLANYLSNTVLKERLERLGTQSYTIYILHQPFCCAFLGLMLTKMLGGVYALDLISCMLCCAVSIFVPQLLVKIAYRLGMGFILKKTLNLTL